MDNRPRLSGKLIVLVKKALEEEVCNNDGSLDELIEAYNLPSRRLPKHLNSARADLQEYYQSVVSDLDDPYQKSENAAIILTALIVDSTSDSPVLDRSHQWTDINMAREVFPLHIRACRAQLKLEMIDEVRLTEWAMPIVVGLVKRGADAPPPTAAESKRQGTDVKHPLRASRPKSGAPRVFIIHGHDELNVRRLQEYLKDNLKLISVVMSTQPGKGRTLIEKFEEESEGVGFAFAILTPDDVVQSADGQYAQARPNVIFELGWFYGRLGRQNVCILLKEGTQIHSDLDGISRIEVGENVTDKAIEIEKELSAAGIGVRQDRSN